jgi:hypothetical protein
MVPRSVIIQNGTDPNQSVYDSSMRERRGHGIPILHISNIGHPLNNRYLDEESYNSGRFAREVRDQHVSFVDFTSSNLSSNHLAVNDLVTSNNFLTELNHTHSIALYGKMHTNGTGSSLEANQSIHLTQDKVPHFQNEKNPKVSGISGTAAKIHRLSNDLSTTPIKKSSENDKLTKSNSVKLAAKLSEMSTDSGVTTLSDVTTAPDSSLTAMTMTADMSTVTPNSTTPRPFPASTMKPGINKISSAPDLWIIILFPLPFFLLTSLIRKVRYLAPFTSIATAALAAGAISVLGFIVMCKLFIDR